MVKSYFDSIWLFHFISTIVDDSLDKIYDNTQLPTLVKKIQQILFHMGRLVFSSVTSTPINTRGIRVLNNPRMLE